LVKKSEDEELLGKLLEGVKNAQSHAVKLHQQLLEAGQPLPGKEKRILVVDDEAYNCEVL